MQAGVGVPMPATEPRSVAKLIEEAEDLLLVLRRSYAGYQCLTAALLGASGGLPPGERVRGLPLLTYQATVDGVHAIEVVIDLKDVETQYLQHVMGPLINVHAKKAVLSCQEGITKLQEILDLFSPTQASAAAT